MAKKSKSAPPVDDTGDKSRDQAWLILSYEPVSLFSLRSTYSMSKGGKTLLSPTPYAIKMALIDACFRSSDSISTDQLARAIFNLIKGRNIRLRPPPECVVQNTYVKIRQDERDGEAGHYVPTIAYRELVFFSGSLQIAIDVGGLSSDDIQPISHAAAHVNYFGKRGSFFQFTQSQVVTELPSFFSISSNDNVALIAAGVYGVTQYMDDFGPELCTAKDGFERISTFHPNDIKIGKHRVLVSTLLPYQKIEATRTFTRYVSPHS